jgi:DNA polymerase-3 subunit epsilon/ATP-dependent DNA helicase DinG
VAQHPQQPLRVAIDLEMTGSTVGEDAIIEIGAVRFAGNLSGTMDGQPFQSFVRAQKPIPYSVRRLTGIGDDMLRTAPALRDGIALLERYIGDAQVVGHNIATDARFLRAAGLALRGPLLDTYELAVTVLPRLQSYTLEALATYLDVRAPRYHRALDDAQTTRRVFLKLLAHLQTLNPQTRDDLARVPSSAPWTVGELLKAIPDDVASVAPASGLGGLGASLGARLAEQHDISPRVYQISGLGQAPQPPFQNSGEMLAITSQAQARVRPAVAQQTLRLLTEGGALLLDLDNDRADLVSLLTPAARWAVDTGGRVVISAPDAATMRHVARAVAPEAFAAADVSRSQFSVAELSERESYLCLRRWFGGATFSDGAGIAADVTRGLARLTVWSKDAERGSRWELSLPTPEESAWERSRAGVEVRDSAVNCPYDVTGYCFLSSAQTAANAARMVVTTHKALAASLLGKDDLLPPATRVIALDPYALEEALRDARAHALRYDFVTALLHDLCTATEDGRHTGLLHWAWQAYCPDDPMREQAWANEVDRAVAAAEGFFAALHIAGQLIAPDPKQRTAPVDRDVRRSPAWRQVSVAWDGLRGALDAIINLVRAIANEAEAQSPRATSELAGAMVELLFAARQLEAARDAGDELLAPMASQSVAWIDRPDGAGEHAATPRGRKLSGGPVQCDTDLLGVYPRYGDAVRPLSANGNGLLLAGPGLAAGGDFDYSRGMFGLPSDTRAANFGRDRSEQTLLCLPTDVPEPGMQHYQERLNQTLIRLAMELDGRLVVYFASRSALRASAQGIRHMLEQRGILVLAQGIDGSARSIWRVFNAERRVALLGGSFWNAMPEQARRRYCIVIPRLPLPAESDPVVAARAERWDEPYEQYSIPTAAQRMRVALSRLAWSHDERNAVVLFDRRAQTRDYGHAALATLPHCQELRAPVDEIAREVADWIGPA